jgi:hypothetical protein
VKLARLVPWTGLPADEPGLAKILAQAVPHARIKKVNRLAPHLVVWHGADYHPATGMPGRSIKGVLTAAGPQVKDLVAAAKSVADTVNPNIVAMQKQKVAIRNANLIMLSSALRAAKAKVLAAHAALGLEVSSKKTPNVGNLYTALADAKNQESLALKQLGEETKETESVPSLEMFHLSAQMDDQKEKEFSSGGNTIISGSLFMQSVFLPAGNIGPGVPLAVWPLHPTFMGDSRISAFGNLFDLYRWKACVIEWRPIVGSSVGGVVAGYCEPDVMADESAITNGSNVVRDALSRPGAEMNSLFYPAAYVINMTQQGILYCANIEVPSLSIGALFNLVTASSGLPTATGLGVLFLHYEIEFMQATSSRVNSTLVNGPTALNASFVGVVLTNNGSFWTTSGLFPAFTSRGQIAAMQVSSFVDGATNPNWRILRYGDAGTGTTVGAGTRLWARLDNLGTSVVFYPSLGAAMLGQFSLGGSQSYSDGFYNSATNTGVGNSILFDNIVMWSLPADVI